MENVNDALKLLANAIEDIKGYINSEVWEIHKLEGAVGLLDQAVEKLIHCTG